MFRIWKRVICGKEDTARKFIRQVKGTRDNFGSTAIMCVLATHVTLRAPILVSGIPLKTFKSKDLPVYCTAYGPGYCKADTPLEDNMDQIHQMGQTSLKLDVGRTVQNPSWIR